MRTIIDEEERESTDTEITLGMKSLLGVFFGAVLVCGIFFGFGYSLGRSNAHPAPPADTPNPAIAVKPSASADGGTGAGNTGSGDDSALKTVVSDQTPETDSQRIHFQTQSETSETGEPLEEVRDSTPAKGWF